MASPEGAIRVQVDSSRIRLQGCLWPAPRAALEMFINHKPILYSTGTCVVSLDV